MSLNISVSLYYYCGLYFAISRSRAAKILQKKEFKLFEHLLKGYKLREFLNSLQI